MPSPKPVILWTGDFRVCGCDRHVSSGGTLYQDYTFLRTNDWGLVSIYYIGYSLFHIKICSINFYSSPPLLMRPFLDIGKYGPFLREVAIECIQ